MTHEIQLANGRVLATNVATINVRIGRMAHEDNYSYWEDRLSKADDDALDAMAVSVLDQIEDASRSKGKVVKMTLPTPLAVDLMNQHGYLGDVEEASGDYELRAVGLAHRRAAIAIHKALAAVGIDAPHPSHWWKN